MSETEYDPRMGISFAMLRRANLQRLPLFRNEHGELSHPYPHQDGSNWSESDWLGAVTGELGELANLLKKRRRGDFGGEMTHAQATEMNEAVMTNVAAELADIAIYLDILAYRLGVDLGQAIIRKFNIVSDKVDHLAPKAPRFVPFGAFGSPEQRDDALRRIREAAERAEDAPAPTPSMRVGDRVSGMGLPPDAELISSHTQSGDFRWTTFKSGPGFVRKLYHTPTGKYVGLIRPHETRGWEIIRGGRMGQSIYRDGADLAARYLEDWGRRMFTDGPLPPAENYMGAGED